jgi:hypothetical protein
LHVSYNPEEKSYWLSLSFQGAFIAGTAILASCVDPGIDPDQDVPVASITSAVHVGTGIGVSVQQSDTQYRFLAGAPYLSNAQYYWYLVPPGGSAQFVQYTGASERLDFAPPVGQFPSGEYWFFVDIYPPEGGFIEVTSDGLILPLLRSTPDVGVIPNGSSCPPATETVHIGMDNEDSRPASSASGWVGGTIIDGNANYVFCRVNGTRFASLSSGSSPSTNYAVLRLGAYCPSGSIPFSRYFDNEDDNNGNWWTGNIAPNMNIGNSTLNFCLFAGGGSPAPLPDLGFSYGVFAGPSFAFSVAHGTIFSDDEDNNNQNGYTVDANWQGAAQAIIVPGGNTILYTARIPACGDNLCTNGETPSSCPADCDVCGNGICRANESVYSCPQDCAVCGDGVCSPGESCAADCNPTTCGNSMAGIQRARLICPAI